MVGCLFGEFSILFEDSSMVSAAVTDAMLWTVSSQASTYILIQCPSPKTHQIILYNNSQAAGCPSQMP